MSIRFAAPPSTDSVRMTQEVVRDVRTVAANDNGDLVETEHIHAALRHFAKFGIAAAKHAREQAIAASQAGDRATFEWWLEICRALDRRMARGVDHADCSGSA